MHRMTLLAAVALLVAPSLVLAQRGDKLAILKTYKGTVDKAKKPEIKTGFIATAKAWKKVWKKINAKEKAPKVNFKKHILLVSHRDAADPNRRGVTVIKDKKGVVSTRIFSTRIGFRPSNRVTFEFYQIARDGLTGVQRYDIATRKMVVEKLPK